MKELSCLTWFCFFLAIAATSNALGWRSRNRLHHQLTKITEVSSPLEAVANETKAYFKQQKVNHFDPEDGRVFSQKYFESLAYFEPQQGPIFLVMCGESSCNEGYFSWTYVGDLARSFQGAVVTLEHRFYGESYPFQNFSYNNLKYLTTQQSLYDHAFFIEYYQNLINQQYNKQGKNKWVIVGGSYSGALSAWFRVKFPHLVVASWASSAVVEAILEYSAYDMQVGISVGPECKSILQKITKMAEQGLATNASATKSIFSAQKLKDDDFLVLLADLAAGYVQYGFSQSLCTPLLDAARNKTNLLMAYSNIFNLDSSDIESFDANIFKKKAEENDPDYKDAMSWTYQTCTELAYFQVAPANDSVRSSRINLQYYIDYCAQLFGNGTFPDVKGANLNYGGNSTAGSNIIFLNGSQDPWQHASRKTLSSQEPSYTLTCSNCAHCEDLNRECTMQTDLPRCKERFKAHAYISLYMKEWLYA